MNRFWIGGTGTWSATNTANWSSSAGGLPGATVPTAADNVFFDGGSGTGTCTMAVGYNPTIGTFTFTTNNFTINLNDNNLSCVTYNISNLSGVARVLAFGTSGQITIRGNNGTVAQWRYENGLTYTGSKKFVLSYTGNVGTRNLAFPSFNSVNALPNIYVTGGSDIIGGSGASGMVTGDFNFTGFSGKFTPNQWFLYGSLIFSPTMTLSAAPAGGLFTVATSGTYTITTNGAPWPSTQIVIAYATVTSSSAVYVFTDANLTLPTTTLSCGTLDFASYNTNVTFSSTFTSTSGRGRSIRWGTGTFTASATAGTIIDMANLTGMTYVGSPTITLSGLSTSAQTRTINCGSASGTVNLAININVPAGADTVNLNGYFANATFGSSFTGILGSTTSRVISGNLTLVSGMTTAPNSNMLTFTPIIANATVTTAGVTINSPVTMVGSAGTLIIGDNFTMGSTYPFALSQGTLNCNGKTISFDSFVSITGLVRTFYQNGATINVFGNNAAVVNIASGNFLSTGAVTFNLTYAGSVGTRTISVASNSTFNLNVQSGTDIVALTCTITNLNFTGFAGTLLNGARQIFANLTYSSGMTASEGNVATNLSTIPGTTAYLTTNGIPIAFPHTISGQGQTVLADNYNGNALSSNAILTVNNGNVNIGNVNVSVWSTAISALGNSNLVIDSGNFNVVGTTGNIITVTSPTNLKRTDGFTFNLTGNSGSSDTRQIVFASTLSPSTQAFNINATNGAGNLSVALNSPLNSLTLADGFVGNLTGTNAFTMSGNLSIGNNAGVVNPVANIVFGNASATATQTVYSPVANIGMGLTASSAGNLTFISNVTMGPLILGKGNVNLNEQVVNASKLWSSVATARTLNFGNANLNIYGSSTSVVYINNGTNLAVTGTKNLVATANTTVGTRTVYLPYVANEANAMSLYVENAADTLAIGGFLMDLTINNLTANLWYDDTKTILGNFIVKSPAKHQPVINHPSETTFAGANKTQLLSIDDTGIDLGSSYNINAPGSNVVFDYDLYADVLTVTEGNLINSNSAAIIANSVSMNGSNIRGLIVNDANVDLQGFGTVWYMPTSTNLNLALANSNININHSDVIGRSFIPGENLNYPNVVINSTLANTVTNFYGNVHYESLSSNVSVDYTVQFAPGVTNSFDHWAVSGSNSSNLTLTSLSSKGVIAPHNLVFTGVGDVNVANANISYSHANPADTWYSLYTNNNINSGNNSGWIFEPPTPPSGQQSNYYLLWW